MIFQKIKHYIQANKKIIYYFGFFLALFIFSSESTFAEFKTEDVAKGFSEVMKVISVFLGLMTYLTTMFLSPEWINGNLFGMTAKFKEVWILVSNVVYFIFAFILIWIAFMNIIGKTGDNYELKKALPKFIVGILIVPFSWFLVQFILSISAILTISALSLPSDTFPEYESKLGKVTIPKACTIDLSSVSGTGTTDKTSKTTSFIDCPKDEKVELATILNGGDSTSTIYGLISTYTYGVISFDTIGSLSQYDISSVKNLGDLVIKIVFDFLFIIVYSILMITLGIVLMIRGIYIWIYIMLSPLFGLMYFFGKTEGGEGFFGKFNVKEFIALAMVPVYTMLALSFGLLFMYVVGSGLSNNNVESIAGGNKVSVTSEGEVSSIVIGKDSANGFTLNFKGLISKDNGSSNTFLKEIGGGALGIIGALILKLFGIVVLWGTLLAAMRTSEITKQITQPIYDFGASVGKIASSAPGNIPIFGGQSANSMSQVASSGSNYFNSTLPGQKSSKFMSDHNLFGNETSSIDAKDIKSQLATNNWGAITKSIKKGIDNAGDANIASNKTDLIDSLLAVAKELKIDAYKDTKVDDIKGKAQDYVKLIASIDNKVAETKKGQGIDIIPDNGATKTNLSVGEYNNLIGKGNISKNDNNSSDVNTKKDNIVDVKINNTNNTNNANVTLDKNTGKLGNYDIVKNDLDNSKFNLNYNQSIKDYIIKNFGLNDDLKNDENLINNIVENIKTELKKN